MYWLTGSVSEGLADNLTRRLAQQTALSAVQAVLALTAYEAEHGELPDTLDALVPDYLPAVPRDYFDGAPIRYSQELRAVWSVGSEGTYIARQGGELRREDIGSEPIDLRLPDARERARRLDWGRRHGGD